MKPRKENSREQVNRKDMSDIREQVDERNSSFVGNLLLVLFVIWYLKHEGEERKQRRAGKQKRGLICQIFVGWRLFWDASLLDISGQMVQNASWCGLVFVTDATPDECSLAGWMCNWRENVKKLQKMVEPVWGWKGNEVQDFSLRRQVSSWGVWEGVGGGG